jgi:hypothetical protein
MQCRRYREKGMASGNSKPRGGWEAPDDLEALQEKREIQPVRANFGSAKFILFGGPGPCIEIFVGCRIHQHTLHQGRSGGANSATAGKPLAD